MITKNGGTGRGGSEEKMQGEVTDVQINEEDCTAAMHCTR